MWVWIDQVLAKYYALKKQAARKRPTRRRGDRYGRCSVLPVDGETEKPGLDGSRTKKANLLVMASVGVVLVVGVAVGQYLPETGRFRPRTTGRWRLVRRTLRLALPRRRGGTRWRTGPDGQAAGGERNGRCRRRRAAAVLPADEGRLVVEASEVVWLGLYQLPSRTIIFEGTLQPGERREWQLTTDVSLRIGNAGGLRVVYEGQDLGKLGSSGQVISKVLTVD